MGRRGTRPKPVAQHKLHGTYRAADHGNAVSIPSGVPQAPAHLKGIALKEWNRVVPQLAAAKILSESDQTALATYCETAAVYRKLMDRIEKDRWISIGSTGRETSHYLIPAMHVARADMLRYMREFGLTPSARTAIKVSPSAAPSDLEKKMLGIVG